MRLQLQLVGDKALERKLAELARQYPDATGAALYQEGLAIWRNAAKRAPTEFGVLKNSAYVAPPVLQGGETRIEVGFGTHYAVYQEQTEGLRHPRGGQAHFLRTALEDATSGYLERVGRRIEQNVAAGVRAPALAAPAQPVVTGERRRSVASKRLRKARRR